MHQPTYITDSAALVRPYRSMFIEKHLKHPKLQIWPAFPLQHRDFHYEIQTYTKHINWYIHMTRPPRTGHTGPQLTKIIPTTAKKKNGQRFPYSIANFTTNLNISTKILHQNTHLSKTIPIRIFHHKNSGIKRGQNNQNLYTVKPT